MPIQESPHSRATLVSEQTDPKANLHVDVTGNSDGFAVGGKNISLTTSYGTRCTARSDPR